MKNIKILHLFPHLLSLYGEYGNVSILQKVLTDEGCNAEVTTWDSGDLTLDGYDFIYIGSGTEDNLLEAVKRLLPHKDAIAASVAAGTPWLVTGNAMTIFGSTIIRRGQEIPALRSFDYVTEIHDGKRYLGDALTSDCFGSPLIGFVNTSCVYRGIDTPLLELKLNPELGNGKTGPADGIRQQNFYGTQLIGPVLVKNPHFLSHMIREITGLTPTLSPDTNIRKAYEVSLNELKKRVQ